MTTQGTSGVPTLPHRFKCELLASTCLQSATDLLNDTNGAGPIIGDTEPECLKTAWDLVRGYKRYKEILPKIAQTLETNFPEDLPGTVLETVQKICDDLQHMEYHHPVGDIDPVRKARYGTVLTILKDRHPKYDSTKLTSRYDTVAQHEDKTDSYRDYLWNSHPALANDMFVWDEDYEKYPGLWDREISDNPLYQGMNDYFQSEEGKVCKEDKEKYFEAWRDVMRIMTIKDIDDISKSRPEKMSRGVEARPHS